MVRRRKGFSLILFLSLAFGLFPISVPSASSTSPCERIAFGGPWVFTRESGQPRTEEVSFSIANPDNNYFLRIINGNEDGTNRVSSGTVTLNGVPVAGPSDFNQQVTVIERDVSLQEKNLLEVKLTSARGSFITVYVRGDDIIAPKIEITEPADGSVVNTGAIDVLGTVDDSSATITVNGIPASLVNRNTFIAPNLPVLTGENTISVSATDVCGNTASESITVILKLKVCYPLLPQTFTSGKLKNGVYYGAQLMIDAPHPGPRIISL